MHNRIRRFAAGAAIALGIAHLIYGMVAFKALTPDHIWFTGAGIAMICVGISNWNRPATLQAAIMTAYFLAMAIILPLPQVFLGIGIFLTLLALGVTQNPMRKV